MDSIKERILENKPNLSKQSISTYTSILKSLHNKVYKNEEVKLEDFNNVKKILEFLEELEPNKRKTVLSALVVLTNKKEYREQMLKDINQYNEDQHSQVMNEKQSESWVETDDVKRLAKILEKEVKLIYKKENKNIHDLQTIQNYIIICLLGGLYIPPRRSKDYVEFKINNINKEKDNYMTKNTFVFNNYKTAKTYGQQIVEVPTQLLNIIKKWLKINPTDYLLFDSNKKQLTNVKMTQRLNKLFDKKVSVNQLRHTYLSDKYQGTIDVNRELAKTMKDMGSSIIQEKVYIKKHKEIEI